MPRWQPNGEYIIFSSDLNGQWDLFSISADGALVRQLTNDEYDERGPVAEAVTEVVPTAAGRPCRDRDAFTTRAARRIGQCSAAEPAPEPGRRRDDHHAATARHGAGYHWTDGGQHPVQVVTPEGRMGWVYAPLLRVNISLASVPVVNVQFIPPPPTAIPTITPIPATPIPATGVNLVAGIVVLEPAGPVCAQTFNVGFDVANLGTAPTTIGGTVSLVDRERGWQHQVDAGQLPCAGAGPDLPGQHAADDQHVVRRGSPYHADDRSTGPDP